MSNSTQPKDFRKFPRSCFFKAQHVGLPEPPRVRKDLRERQNDEATLIDLFAELKVAFTEKAVLESENTLLKKEHDELKEKNASLARALSQNKLVLQNEVEKHNREMKFAQDQLLEKCKTFIIQQKKYTQKIKTLQKDKERLKLTYEEKEKQLFDTIKLQESELKQAEERADKFRKEGEENAAKATKYKAKLRYAVSMINDLNTLLLQYSSKVDTVSEAIQTFDEEGFEDEEEMSSIQSYPPTLSQPRPESEDFILSELFFKSKAFCDNELVMLNKESCAETTTLSDQ